ncbi:MAG: translation initiation factor [Muribaculaceae bacterium]|nr:translation initiation factor [Muribaculaceae bacterium]MBR1474738.1 translation initiation factor [Muribaculaceae bacterium]MBR1725227.1 translation initiation factor [Muribaculaceae bacterium]
MDWKDKLGAAFGMDVPTPEQIEAERAAERGTPRGDALQQQGRQTVHVVIERKGRAGKVATLVVDLVCDDTALKQLASELKQQLGVGGSARGGEILIQGDHRDRVMQLLRQRGFVVK